MKRLLSAIIVKLVELVGWIVYRTHPGLAAGRELRIRQLKDRAFRGPQEMEVAELQRLFPESVEAMRRMHRIESELAAYQSGGADRTGTPRHPEGA